MDKREVLLSIFFIVIITAITFSPVIKNGFTLWDDNIYILENTLVKELSLENIRNIFTTFTLGNYHPLTLLSFSIEYYFFGPNPHVYHSTNLILHILNCILVFLLIFMLSRNISVSLLAALVFGLHPLRVESVAWVSDRKDLLCAFFFLISIIGYLYYQRKKYLKYYILSLAAFALSLLSKAMAITLPIVLIILDYFFDRKFKSKMILEKIPYFIMAMTAGIINICARQGYQFTLQEGAFSVFQRILINIHRFVFYFIMRMIVPMKLSFLKPYVKGILPLPFYVFIIAALIIIAVLAYIVIASAKRTRYLVFGSLFMIITLSPVLMVTVLGYSADRFTYLASIGLCFIASQAFFDIYNRYLKKKKTAKTAAIFALCGIVGLFSFISWKRCAIWKDSISLENYFVENYPEDPRVYLNRGVAYEERGDHEKAIADYSKSLSIKPDYIEVYLRRGIAYLNKGQYDQAIRDLNRTIALDPGFSKAYFHRGIVHDLCGEYDQAIADFTRALDIDPGLEAAFYNRGAIYLKTGNPTNAIADFDRAIALFPNYAEAYVNRGMAKGLLGLHEQAIQDFTRAIQINPGLAQAYNNRGFAYSQTGEYERAIADYTTALKIDPNNQNALQLRAKLLSIR
jgi:tetratricopeptide (TPR) repeat protein